MICKVCTPRFDCFVSSCLQASISLSAREAVPSLCLVQGLHREADHLRNSKRPPTPQSMGVTFARPTESRRCRSGYLLLIPSTPSAQIKQHPDLATEAKPDMLLPRQRVTTAMPRVRPRFKRWCRGYDREPGTETRGPLTHRLRTQRPRMHEAPRAPSVSSGGLTPGSSWELLRARCFGRCWLRLERRVIVGLRADPLRSPLEKP